ncbi:FAD-dependent oxidoreductase [Saccharopolyspora sp. ID03-671]|uniref:FAD-dependent oxidoreductase n=1 Tax=Saccharopolyspora sp. ID03-671 TaxID=3073066 RepID=UPI0032551FC0
MIAHRNTDLVVLGGGLAGVAAALAVARLGGTAVIVSETEWLGGQVSSQGIPPDEHPWIETTGCAPGYRAFRDAVRDFYRRHYPLTAAARSQARLNPGLGNIGPISHEPSVAALVIEELVAPWRALGRITVLRGFRVTGAVTARDRVDSVTVTDGDREHELRGTSYLDATDLGDLLEAAAVEHVIGAESRDQTGEPHALDAPDPLDQQAITWALALAYEPGADHVIDRPDGYARWRDYRPDFWPGPLLGWTVSDYVTHEPRERPLFLADPPENGVRYDLWHARRVLAADQLESDSGLPPSDITIAAWPMMDYFALPLVGADEATTARALDEAREFTLSFLHWMQTEAPRHDGGQGYPELVPRGDVLGTHDGLAQLPYVREGRRIVPEFRVCEQHIGVEARPGRDGAERFHDSVGIGAYRMDLHPSTSGRNTLDLDTWPFEIPLGALLPARVDNVLAAGKTMGTTHLTNGAYRVHPVEWTAGEAAGALAAYCAQRKAVPRQVRSNEHHLAELQRLLTGTLGAELRWPDYGPLTPTRRFGYVPTGARGANG